MSPAGAVRDAVRLTEHMKVVYVVWEVFIYALAVRF